MFAKKAEKWNEGNAKKKQTDKEMGNSEDVVKV